MRMRTIVAAVVAAAAIGVALADDYASEIAAWRAKADAALRRDLGWLTIAGRWELKEGENTLGSGAGNDVVLPKSLAPAKLGTLVVDKGRVTLRLARGARMWLEPLPGEHGIEFVDRTLGTRDNDVEWVSSGRLSLYVYTRPDGKAILRIADRESAHRRQFAGRAWYDVDPAMRVPARFVPYPAGTKIPVANVRGEISEEDAAGRIEFSLNGRTMSLDAFAEDDGALFILVRDATSGATTYPAGRFLRAPKPVEGATIVDFNKAYNPPCAFSAYTTCPLPPPQNWVKAPIAAGEKYAGK